MRGWRRGGMPRRQRVRNHLTELDPMRIKTRESASRRGFLSTIGGALGSIMGCASPAVALQHQRLRTTIAPAPPFRRVVTGFNAAGKSTITSDGPVPPAARYIHSTETVI